MFGRLFGRTPQPLQSQSHFFIALEAPQSNQKNPASGLSLSNAKPGNRPGNPTFLTPPTKQADSKSEDTSVSVALPTAPEDPPVAEENSLPGKEISDISTSADISVLNEKGRRLFDTLLASSRGKTAAPVVLQEAPPSKAKLRDDVRNVPIRPAPPPPNAGKAPTRSTPSVPEQKKVAQFTNPSQLLSRVKIATDMSTRARAGAGFKRRQSTADLMKNIHDKKYPSLNNDPKLKGQIENAFNSLIHFDYKQGRPDVQPSSFGLKLEQIVYVGELQEEIDKKLLKIKIDKNNSTVADIQRETAKVMTKVYTEHYEKDNKIYQTRCGQISRLLYCALCTEGVSYKNMRLLSVENKESDGDYQNHTLIVYSSNENLLERLGKECGITGVHQDSDSYSNFINICSECNQNDILLILDPWSRDNKIIDLSSYVNDENKGYLIDSRIGNALRESAVTPPNVEYNPSNQPQISVFIDY